MLDIGTAASILGLMLLVAGSLTAAYFLLFGSVDIKRVVTFAGILTFSALFLLLFERVTLVELPGSLGKITVQARQDAAEIRGIRNEVQAQSEAVARTAATVTATAEKIAALTKAMEQQRQTVTGIVSEMNATAARVSALKENTEQDFAAVREARREDRRRYLGEQIAELEKQWSEMQRHELRVHAQSAELGMPWSEWREKMWKIENRISELRAELDGISETPPEGASIEGTE